MTEGGGDRRRGRGECPRFFADAMLGRLATWLSILGCDVEYSRDIDDGELAERATREERIILTRDTLLIKRRSVRERCFLVESDRWGEQLRQVAEGFGLGGKDILTRCIRCNSELDEVERGSVKGLVPPYVFDTQEDFSRCPLCGRIYWAGTHRDHILEELSDILKDAS